MNDRQTASVHHHVCKNSYLLPVRRITPRNRSGPVRSPVLDRSWAGLDLPVLISSWGIGLATVDRSELQGSIPYFRGEIAGSVRWGRSVQWSRSVQCDQPVLQERDTAEQIGLTVWIDLTEESDLFCFGHPKIFLDVQKMF